MIMFIESLISIIFAKKYFTDPRDKNVKRSTVVAYNKLNTFITNIALNQMQNDFRLSKNIGGLDYLSQTLDIVFEGFRTEDIR